MDVDSVKSGHSDTGYHRSVAGHHRNPSSNVYSHPLPISTMAAPAGYYLPPGKALPPHLGGPSHPSSHHGSHGSHASSPLPPPPPPPPLPQQHHHPNAMYGPQHHQEQWSPPGSAMDGNGGQMGAAERIEVQILPQDDNWGETGTTTALTGPTSDTNASLDDLGARLGGSADAKQVGCTGAMGDDGTANAGFDCARSAGTALAVCLGVVAFLSPIAMVTLPRLNLIAWQKVARLDCTSACEGQLIALAFKQLILLIGTWALFFRPAKASMPRVYIFRALILFLVFIVTFAFWLFYGVRILGNRSEDYYNIVVFAVSLVDALLFVHYLGIVLLELRHLQLRYSIKVIRSPDGVSKVYRLGEMSIQRAAVVILQNYMTDFEVFNPYLDTACYRRSRHGGIGIGANGDNSSEKRGVAGSSSALANTQYKFYDVDGSATGGPPPNGSVLPASVARSARSGGGGSRSGRSGASERFYEEMEYEKRVRKRKARLLAAVEEAFTHIRRLNGEKGHAKPMDPYEAAQSVFPTLLKPLQKYLRITRQQPRYTMEMVIQHLAICISHDLSPRAFAERYLNQGSVIDDARAYRKRQTWTLLCDSLLSRGLEDGTLFQLRQGDVSLLCTVRRLPFFSLAEEILDPKRNRFVLRLNSETSV